MKKLLLAALLLFAPVPAFATPGFGSAVTTCGTLPGGNYRPGFDGPITVDLTGQQCIAVTLTPSGTQDVNITKVAGAAVATGHGTAAGALRVELPTDGTGIVGIAAGTAVIGHVITDTGSTTAVTQPTGTNLHAVIDTGSTTAVTQATGTNLHAVLDTTSTTAVTQATGTNLHAVLDTTSTTAVTQATGTNLHTVVDSGTITAVTAITNALPAGTNIIGNVRVDQTTPGTTNGVVVNSGTLTAVTAITNALPAGTNAIGTVQPGNTQNTTPWMVVQGVSTLTTSITRPADTTAYSANDAFANSTSSPTSGGFTLTSACRASGGFGTITDAAISASAGTAYNGEIWVFDQAVTATNDNSALSVSDSDILNLVGIIPFNTSDVNAANSISFTTGLNIGYTCVGTANLRFLVKIVTAVTPGNAEVLSIRVKVQN